jgi:hypothetical protein
VLIAGKFTHELWTVQAAPLDYGPHDLYIAKYFAANGFFVALWLLSAALFRKAAAKQPTDG